MKNHAADTLSIAELVDRYSAMIYRIAYTRMQNASDAEDVTQEVFLKYLKADKEFEDEEHRKLWLIRVTVNTIKSTLTSAWRRHNTMTLEDISEPVYTERESYGLKERVEELPEKYRIPMFLYYYEELPVKEIACVLQTTEGTVKSLLSRGREKLRNVLREEDYV